MTHVARNKGTPPFLILHIAGNPDTSPWPISNFTVTVPPPTPGDTTTWSYTFTQTGRKVHNDVRARFRFADGLIAEHDDSFGFHSWARQALGPPGLLLGWTPIIQGPVRRRARAGLDEFMAADGS